MAATIIGISSGILIIFIIGMIKQFDKRIIFGLALSGIGFLYVGFAWTNLQELVVNAIQAIIFLFLAYYGIKKGFHILAAGYLLHGCWDFAYHYFQDPELIPPHYDLFCLSIDFTFAAYLLFLHNRFRLKKTLN